MKTTGSTNRLPTLVRRRGTLPTRSPLVEFIQQRRCLSSLPRPYKFHVGVAWARKPPDDMLSETLRAKLAAQIFRKGSPKGKWRDSVLGMWQRGADAAKDRDEDPEHGMGEDFLFVQPMRGESGTAVGIADGVGGWSLSGVDPSLFAQSLMYHSHLTSAQKWAFPPDSSPSDYMGLAGEGWVEVGEEIGPREIMSRAYHGVLQDADVDMGASTACVVTLNAKNGRLRAANLGDSGFTIIRSSDVHHVQPPQIHYFNCPKQLSKYPGGRRYTSKPLLDFPADADTYECTLRHGDILLLYTDGLSDNVFPSELVELSALALRASPNGNSDTPVEQLQIQRLAESCVLHSRMCMMDFNRLTPFEVTAKEEGGWEWIDWRGGKIDDVTVLAVLVTEGM